MRRRWIPTTLTVLVLLLGAGTVHGQDDESTPVAELVLVDGTTLRGRIVSETATHVVIESETLGQVEIDRTRIRSVTYQVEAREQPAETGAKPGWRDDPDVNSLLLVPTAETLPAGDVYYRNFLLLFNNLGLAVSDNFNLSVMATFPITADAFVFSLGAKLRLLSREKSGVGIAASASAWFADDENLGTIGGIVSFGDRRRSLTAAVNVAFVEDDSETFFLVGGDVQVGPGLKLLAEYGNSESAISDENDFNGIINVGFRLFWEKTSFTLTGFRPLEETGDFIAFPLAMFSAHF